MSSIELHLEQNGVKPTAMRILVYQELEKAQRPLSLKELEEQMLTAERSTIFRTLTLLLNHHLIHALEDGSGSIRYETCKSPDHQEHDDQHIHFYCERCHRTFCFRDTKIPPVELPDGFQMYSINYMVKGLCPQCKDTTHTP